MAVVKTTKTKIKEKVESKLIVNKEQLLKLAEEIAPGLADAIQEFFVAKDELDPELLKQLDDYEGPDTDNVAGMDNVFFEDKGEI